jgi:uncharacterized protein YbcV (DUF1398 family)
MNTEIMDKTTNGSFDGTITFPEVVKALMEIGVESYRVDLIENEKNFYMPSGETHTKSFDFRGPKIADEFSANGVVAALREIQAKRTTYTEFLEQIMKAGSTSYQVFIRGMKAVYIGRKGDLHVENIPTAKQ